MSLYLIWFITFSQIASNFTLLFSNFPFPLIFLLFSYFPIFSIFSHFSLFSIFSLFPNFSLLSNFSSFPIFPYIFPFPHSNSATKLLSLSIIDFRIPQSLIPVFLYPMELPRSLHSSLIYSFFLLFHSNSALKFLSQSIINFTVPKALYSLYAYIYAHHFSISI